MRIRVLVSAVLATATLALCPWLTAGAQQLIVTVRDSALRSPVMSAMVTATDQTNGTRVYALTNAEGRVTMRLPNPGSWTASVRRIGIVPKAAAAVVIAVGATVSVPIDVANLRFTLPGVRVTAKAGVCGRAPSGIDRTSALWEQVTLALRSSAIARGDSAQSPPLRVRLHERTRDLDQTLIASKVIKIGDGAQRPFFAADPDSLAGLGYVRDDPDGMVAFYAPDEVVMLSTAFVRTHCFGTPAKDADPALAELEFAPIPRHRRPDVAGVAYVDTLTGELRKIVFRYVNASAFIPKEAIHAGGDVSLRRLDDGRWIVSDWIIRMPFFVRVSWQRNRALVGYRESGGTTLTAGVALLDSLDAAMLLSVRDSLTRLRPPAGASGVMTSADTSIRAIARPIGMLKQRIFFVSARQVEARTRFAQYRAEGVGFFLDSSAIAAIGAKSAHELLLSSPGMTAFRVPSGVDGPKWYQDVLLDPEWRAGAALPMMAMRSLSTDAGGGALCFPKIYIDTRQMPLSIAELQQLRPVQIATLQIYPPDAAAPLDRRFGHFDFLAFNNRCGLVLMQSYIHYPQVIQ